MNPSSSCMHDTMNAPVSKVFSFLCVLCMNSTQAYMGGLGFPFVCPHVLMIKYLEDFFIKYVLYECYAARLPRTCIP